MWKKSSEHTYWLARINCNRFSSAPDRSKNMKTLFHSVLLILMLNARECVCMWERERKKRERALLTIYSITIKLFSIDSALQFKIIRSLRHPLKTIGFVKVCVCFFSKHCQNQMPFKQKRSKSLPFISFRKV